MITVKPHGGLNATGPQCRKLIEQVGHRNFTLMYDPGNIFYYSDGELNPVEDAKTAWSSIWDVCEGLSASQKVMSRPELVR